MILDEHDFRVGNLVYFAGLKHIITITPNHIVAISEGDSDYEPIPLTPEILEKCGFVWNEELNGFELSGWLPFHIEKRTTLTEWYFLTTFKKDWQIGEKIKSLHQLQNLYYALTNTELTIKL